MREVYSSCQWQSRKEDLRYASMEFGVEFAKTVVSRLKS